MRKWLGDLFLTWGFWLLQVDAPKAHKEIPEEDDDMPGMFSFDIAPKLLDLRMPPIEDILNLPQEEVPAGSIQDRVRIAINNRKREF